MKEECDRTEVWWVQPLVRWSGKISLKGWHQNWDLNDKGEDICTAPVMDMIFSRNRKKKIDESRWVRSVVIEAIAANWLTPSFSHPPKVLGLGKQHNNSLYYQNLVVIHSFKRIICNCRSFWEHEIYVPGKPLFWKNCILIITRLMGKYNWCRPLKIYATL